MNTIRNEKRKVLEWRSSTLHSPLSTLHCPKGFTLVELLTVITIISMLAALSLVALNSAYTEAKIAKTRGTIQKLDAAIQQIFEEYEEKFDAISIGNVSAAQIDRLAQDDFAYYYSTDPPLAIAKAKSAIKFHLICDMMRMEMPQSWAEVFDSEDTAVPKGGLGPIPLRSTTSAVIATPPIPAVYQYYYRAYENYVNSFPSGARTDPARMGPNRAALLYLIIANLNPEALENFHGSEIGDPDGDGLLKFIDAWGHPIQFLRWAPAFAGSDKQPDVVTTLGISSPDSSGWNLGPNDNVKVSPDMWEDPATISDSALQASVIVLKEITEHFSNPLDMISARRGWFLYPLIYSAGPDGIYNLYSEISDGGDLISPTSPRWALAPPTTYQRYWLDPFQFPAGLAGSENSGGHFDNIHNHRSAGGF